MVEVHLWLAWILEKPAERAMLFIEDGLGKEKLMIKHRLDELNLIGRKADDDPVIQQSMVWVESQKYSFLVDVNLSGSWSGIDTRKMAEEAGQRDFYRFTYPPFSSAVHSTWNHVSRFDLVPCTNPLHAGHRVPRMDFLPPAIDFFELAAKYLAKTFALVDSKLHLSVDVPSTFATMFARARPSARKPKSRSALRTRRGHVKRAKGK
jgi:hypothetical protein